MRFVVDKEGKLIKIKGATKKDKVVIVPNNVKTIGHSAFFAQKHIEEIILPNTVKTIEPYAFQECKNLKKINLPDSITNIEESAFYKCVQLEHITLPNKLKNLGSGAFNQCIKLKEINLPSTLKLVKGNTFEYCHELKNITIPKSIERVYALALLGCNNLQQISIGNYFLIVDKELSDAVRNLLHVYYNEETKELIISKDTINKYKYKEVDYFDVINEFKCSYSTGIILNIFFNKQEIKKFGQIKEILGNILNDAFLNKNYENVIPKLTNIKEFNNLIKSLDHIKLGTKSKYAIFKLAYALGAFSDKYIERQRACEFLRNVFEKQYFKANEMNRLFGAFNLKEFDPDFAEFFMNKENFKHLLVMSPLRIAKIHHEFDKIKEFSRSNKGNQKQRKVTIDMCEKYCDIMFFEGEDETNKDISAEIQKYTKSQHTFEVANNIRQSYLKLRKEGLINDHILGEELKEDIFSKIEEVRLGILNDSKDVLENLNKISNNRFSYEFLSKYDPRNFTLGKYCSCCAHLEGFGKGIVRASVLHPDCQNLVIKNEKDIIIAKSTLYINRKQGYGVFNCMEIDDSVDTKEKRMQIYEKYMEAIKIFVEKYNEQNPNRPLRQINTGMGTNDLIKEILANKHKKSLINLEALDFSDFCDTTYKGEWDEGQYILWKKGGYEKNERR